MPVWRDRRDGSFPQNDPQKGCKERVMKKSVAIFALLCILFVFQSVFAADKAPIVLPGLTYDGTVQKLVITQDDNTYFRDPKSTEAINEWTSEIPEGKYPGQYSVEWIINEGGKPAPETTGNLLEFTMAEYNPPKPREGLVFDNSTQYLVEFESGVALGSDSYFYHDIYTGHWVRDQKPSAKKADTYTVEYKLAPWNSTFDDDAPADGSFEVTIAANGPIPPQPGPGPQPVPPSPDKPSRPIYYIGDGTTLFGSGNTLPATGFPTRIHVPLSVKPENINYETLSMRLQIPTINVDVELTGVPEVDGSWAVEWLADQAGLLSGSAMPGEGYAMIAAHNHLNTMEIGPFAMLFSLEENDRIFVNTADDGLQIYTVYANELLEPDDMQKMASIAQSEENSIILVTCENEMVEGGYMNRRAVFAKPQ